uniref:Uncharacterized protein n=1 Tax=Arion vulgaris TaxID=1028688 RepID=A0A0B7ANQ1_9EUPU
MPRFIRMYCSFVIFELVFTCGLWRSVVNMITENAKRKLCLHWQRFPFLDYIHSILKQISPSICQSSEILQAV